MIIFIYRAAIINSAQIQLSLNYNKFTIHLLNTTLFIHTMKLSNFRIKDRFLPKIKTDGVQNLSQYIIKENIQNLAPAPPNDDKFTMFMDSFQSFMGNLVAPNPQIAKVQNKTNRSNPIASAMQHDHRDRYVLINLPEFQNNKVQFNKLQAWIGQLCKEIFSVAFHYYSEGKMTYEQVKVFASESLLRNLSLLADTYKITAHHIKFIDKKMQEDILPYLKTKYPTTIQKDFNRALNTAVKEIDNFQAFANDYFSCTDIVFSHRQNGRYDDIIMQLINEITSKLDMKSHHINQNKEMTNFKDFQHFMTQIFQKSFDQMWMNPGQSMKLSRKTQGEKQKYKSSVQEYTNFALGRKLSQNAQIFTQQQIKSGSLKIKNSSVLRILTKWCEELWQKFKNQNYFLDRIQGLALLKSKNVSLVYPWLKKTLCEQMQYQKQNILKQLAQIEQTNYVQQIQLLNHELELASQYFIQKHEKVTGKFACKVVKNIQNFIIVYINRLIHGLTSVSLKCFQKMEMYPDYWPNPYNLISLRLGDLMRCKYSSKERQVLKILNEINRISDENPGKMKIIRIKNRLKLGTNDILINLKFNNSITCEIQLAVNSAKSQFIKHSYNFNHFIYELQRSQFGPISQICSIWKNLQKRSQEYQKLIARQKPLKQKSLISASNCTQKQVDHNLTDFSKPFLCSQCSKHYYHSSYMIPHIGCLQCNYKKCAVCIIQENIKAKNQSFFLKEEQLQNQCSFWQHCDYLPFSGVLIFKNKPKLQPILFLNYEHNFKQYLFHSANEKFEVLKQFSSARQIKEFTEDCIVFHLDSSIFFNKYLTESSSYNQSNILQRLMSELVIPKYLTKCLKHQKQYISILNDKDLSKVDIQAIICEFEQNAKKIKSIEFSSSSLQDMNTVLPQFVNLRHLNMNLNQIQNISKISKFKKLQTIYMNSNKITTIPMQISQLIQLQQIDLSENQIQQIPPNFTQLKHLTYFNMSSNQIQMIPETFDKLQNLKSLKISKNQIRQFPVCLGRLKNIQHIYLQNNKIQKMPDQIQDLSQLTLLMLNSNKITSLPLKMQKMTKLKTCDLTNNQITSFESLKYWKGLQNLILNWMQIESIQFPEQMISFTHLSKIELDHNRLTAINSTFGCLKHLKKLSINDNHLKQISEQFFTLSNLTFLSLEQNYLKKIPKELSKLSKLLEGGLYLHQNPVSVIEDYEFIQKKGDKFTKRLVESLKEQIEYEQNLKARHIQRQEQQQTQIQPQLHTAD